jgi:hypothetical protein
MNAVEFAEAVARARDIYDSGDYEIAHIHLDRLVWDVLKMAADGENAQARAQHLGELGAHMTKLWYG